MENLNKPSKLRSLSYNEKANAYDVFIIYLVVRITKKKVNAFALSLYLSMFEL